MLPNGSLFLSEVFMEDIGRYGCTIGNSGGFEREEMYLLVNSGNSILLSHILSIYVFENNVHYFSKSHLLMKHEKVLCLKKWYAE